MSYSKDIAEFYRSVSFQELIKKADETCRLYYGDKVFLRGLIEFSNYCLMDCLYCGIRKNNNSIHRYRLTEEDILKIINNGYEYGLKTFVLQSGEDNEWNTSRLCRMIEMIKREYGEEIALTLSCGTRSKQEYKNLKTAGCNRYLIRFETSDAKLHRQLRNGLTLKSRINALYALKELGFETGSGFMTGLPGETDKTLCDNIILAQQLELDMIGIGPFIPHPETPLAGAALHSITLTQKMTAHIRLALPLANIPATTAAGSIDSEGREKMLAAGANVLMPNLTPVEYKKDYLLYPGKICLEETGFQCIGCLAMRVQSVGKQLDYSRGDSISFLNRISNTSKIHTAASSEKNNTCGTDIQKG